MINTVKSLIAVAVLLTGVLAISQAEAKSYTFVFKINLGSDPECIARVTDELYGRVSGAETNPQTGEHDKLIVKFTLHDPANIVKKQLASKHPTQIITVALKFDPKKFQQKYGFPITQMRDYLETWKDEHEIFDHYKHPFQQFNVKRTQYTSTYDESGRTGC